MDNKINVYIIEDDLTMVGLLKTLLNMEGFDVTTLPPKGQLPVLESLFQVNPDVVLLDVNLRDMDGIEILQQIKADQRLQSIKIIMSSGSDYKDRCLILGADNFLLKPYMPDDLIKMIRDVLIA